MTEFFHYYIPSWIFAGLHAGLLMWSIAESNPLSTAVNLTALLLNACFCGVGLHNMIEDNK